ncbi:hypothetical protein [Ralstonia phage RSP15]|uniref:baseplate hub assembly catalyst n=1 Tax=Ralstonia phage RSP15 TaxID=1785960 RepID=UPI00074D2ACA|nr:baseplate hub assembly catalyst [Ralstonia phage RSP15]BAU40015.1 hypothetical protein [Ralstonia phage RSP15]
MLDGKTLESYFRLAHELRERHNISLTEYNAMVPWHLGVYVDLIYEELEAKKNQKKSYLE